MVPAEHDSKRSKTDALEESALNPKPEKVRDPKFQGSEFFDPQDSMQVKYEMLRRVSVDSASVAEVSNEYGVFLADLLPSEGELRCSRDRGTSPKRAGPTAIAASV
ncbi:hypothetical protein [Bradyrhizobium sp. 197]|uniref:hypothetical protein n=1 Tax=Bradyrhizobium sp. 197 TaxID=2782663 RepID=UPI001FF9BCC8|nr:hypothetical protein [Bradyrhizobium sp. 197]